MKDADKKALQKEDKSTSIIYPLKKSLKLGKIKTNGLRDFLFDGNVEMKKFNHIKSIVRGIQTYTPFSACTIFLS